MVKKINILVLIMIFSFVLIFSFSSKVNAASNDWELDSDGYYYLKEGLITSNERLLESHNGNPIEAIEKNYLNVNKSVKFLEHKTKVNLHSNYEWVYQFREVDSNEYSSITYNQNSVPLTFRYKAEAYDSMNIGDLGMLGYDEEEYDLFKIDYDEWDLINEKPRYIKLKHDRIFAKATDKTFIKYYLKHYLNDYYLDEDSNGVHEPYSLEHAKYAVYDFNTESYIYYKVLFAENVFDVDVNELPLTSPNKLGIVTFEVDGYNLSIAIYYNNNVYYLNKSFGNQVDMEIFETIESYFMNIDENPQIIINHSDRPYLRDILENPDEKPAFVPHTIWDLKTNEIKTINTYKTNVYIKQNNEGVLISYVYIDEFIMDKILSAKLSWASRQKLSWFKGLFGKKYSDWKISEQVLLADDYLEYRDLTVNWEIWVPLWNIYRAIHTYNKTYQMPLIDFVNFNNIQPEYNISRIEVETYFKKTNKDFMELKDDPRYKLWAFALQEGASLDGGIVGNLQTQIYHNYDEPDDPMNFKIMEIFYETDGKLYEALGSDMDLQITIHEDIDPKEDETDLLTMIILSIAALGYVYVLVKSRGFNSSKKFVEVTILYAIVMVILYFIFGKYIKL